MSTKDFLVWLFFRKTKPGSKYLYGNQPPQELQGLMAVAIRRAYQNNRTWRAQGRREVQYVDGKLEVRVRSDYNRDHDCDVTDIIVKPLEPGLHGSHQHVIIDGNGNEIMNEWRNK